MVLQGGVRGLRAVVVVVVGGVGWWWVEGQWEQPGCKDLSISASLFPITHLRLWLRPRILPRPSPIVSSIIRARSSAHPHTHQAARPPAASPLAPDLQQKFWEHLFPHRRLPHVGLLTLKGRSGGRAGETKPDQSHACDPCPILRPDEELHLGASPAVWHDVTQQRRFQEGSSPPRSS